jgi:hypothetical protein
MGLELDLGTTIRRSNKLYLPGVGLVLVKR